MDGERKRATVYFDPVLHRALKFKAAQTDRSVSDLVNEAVRNILAEYADDLAAFKERASDPAGPFDTFVRNLRKRGKI